MLGAFTRDAQSSETDGIGEGVSIECWSLSVRFPLPASLYQFDDSSQSVALSSGGALTLTQVRVAASEVSEVALEPAPFGWE